MLPFSRLAVGLLGTALEIRRSTGPHVVDARRGKPLASGGVTREWGRLAEGGRGRGMPPRTTSGVTMRTRLGEIDHGGS